MPATRPRPRPRPPPRAGIHDIFYHILPHLTPDPKPFNYIYNDSTGALELESHDSKSARQTLSRLARVHTSFTRPALAELWRSLPSQKPLEYLLRVTRIARTHTRRPLEKPPLELYRNPEANKAGWSKFQEYAVLVEEIIIDPFVPSVSRPARLLEDTFWCQLSLAIGGAPILPRLKAATFRSDGSLYPIDAGVGRLLSPCICELNFALPRVTEGDIIRLKKALAMSMSSIEKLQVFSVAASNTEPIFNTKLFPRSYPHLRSLTVAHSAVVWLEDLRPLADLPDLECLNINLVSAGLLSGRVPITLSRLSSLKISGSYLSYTNAGALLTNLQVPRLQSFSFSEKHEDSSQMPQEFPNHLRTLIAKCPSLTSFGWTSMQKSAQAPKRGYEGNRQCDVPLAELVAPLLAHRSMRRFSIEFRGPIVPYTPADFRAFAEAWPDLEAFSLDGGWADDSWKHGERYADVETVFAFAHNCPRLRTLVLPRVEQFDSGALLELVRNPPTARHWLREFCVFHVACSREAQNKERHQVFIAQFRGLLVEVFPSVTLDLDRRQSWPQY